MDEEAPFIEKATFQRRHEGRRFSYSTVIPWLLVAILSFYIFVTTLNLRSNATGQSLSWHHSDFTSARSLIEQTETQFTSSLDFIDKQRIFRVYDPSTPTYIGNASTEIDQNWDDLILPADIYVTDLEAATLSPDAKLYRSPESGLYKVELEVFHSLHCLNMIRMRVYADDYPEMLKDNARVHVDHCIESLRELIMCEGNMTPIPIEWSEKGERINPNYAQRHTCRNFDLLKEWMRGRARSPPNNGET